MELQLKYTSSSAMQLLIKIEDEELISMNNTEKIRETLGNIADYFERVSFEILIHEKQPSGRVSEYAIVFRPDDDDCKRARKPQQDHLEPEDINALFDYINWLKHELTKVLTEMWVSFEHIKEDYKDKDCIINIVRKESPVPRRNKRKLSSDSHSEMDRPTKRRRCLEEYPKSLHPYFESLIIGPNGTQLHRENYESVDWGNSVSATMQLCDIVFTEQILATHSLNGNNSLRNGPVKGQLDPGKTADITYLVCSKLNESQQTVHSAIEMRCALASKKIRQIAANKHFTHFV